MKYKIKQESKLVKISVYISPEVREYLNQRKISISRWCRKAIEKRMKIFVHIQHKYQNDFLYRKRRNFIKRKCDQRRKENMEK